MIDQPYILLDPRYTAGDGAHKCMKASAKYKQCSKCRLSKKLAAFNNNRRFNDGKDFYCRRCRSVSHKEYRHRLSKDRVRTEARRVINRPHWRSNWARQRAEARDKILAAYGGKCVCCGESEPLFLTLDHINNDGASARRLIRPNGGRSGTGGGEFYIRVVKSGFPKDLRLLCFNCNCGRARNSGSICPHETKRNIIRDIVTRYGVG